MELALDAMVVNAIKIARAARINVLEMTHTSKASHVGSCLSVIDILASSFTYKIKFEETESTEILLSKGHAAAALYAILSQLNLLEGISLDQYCLEGSKIYGHVNHLASKSIPLSTGSLGHGLPFALGMALANRFKGKPGSVIVILSDGECNEGTTWESALIANQFSLSNLVVIIDRNRIQSLGPTEETIMLEPLADKWKSFGWSIEVVNGHDHKELLAAMSAGRKGPLCIIANTIKGKGVSFMENTVLWHYKSPSSDELEVARAEVLGKGQ